MLLRLWNLGKGLFRSRRARPAAPASAAGESPWLALRKASPATTLDHAAQEWLEALPDHARPKQLSSRHPHVVNRIASVWADRSVCADLLDRLLLDERGGRVGFSPAIRAEFVRLQFLHRKLSAEHAPRLRQPQPATESHPSDA